MKILAVSHEFPPIGGGGANACYFLTKGFVERGHQVTLVTANFEGMPKQENIHGVQVYRVNSLRAHKEHCSFFEMLSYLCKAYPVAKKMQKEEHYDICLVFFGIPSGPIGYLLKTKYKLPYVIRFGGGDVPGFQERFTKVYKLIAPAIRRIWDKADARVANSLGLKKMALSFYNKNDFDIICNGVDSEMFVPIEKQSSEEIQILFVSRLIKRKGLQYVIPYLSDIEKEAGKKVKLLVVGDGPYRTNLEQLAKESGTSHLVHFEGQKSKSEIVPYYQNADLFILPSEKEGMPNVVLEAMACGLPILMTPCEGSEELVHRNGKIVEIGEFVQAIVEMISCEKLSEMSKESRYLIEKEFTWNAVVDKYIDLMQQVSNLE